MCPAFKDNKRYQNWEYLEDPDVFAIACDHDKVEDTLREIVKFAKNTSSLVILDDCAAWQSVKNRTSELVKLALHGRHIGLSTIVITQQLTSIAKPYRMNISKLVIFYSARKDDRRDVFENHLSVNKYEEQKILEALKNKKYKRLEILTVHPYMHKVVVPE